MDEYTYKLFIDAKNSDDIDFMANLYDVNKNDTYIKLEYARMLIKRNQMSFGRSLLLEVLDREYDRIIIDSPPVLAVTDAQILSKKVDGTLLVILANKTKKGLVKNAKELLNKVNANILGVILNGKETEPKEYYGYYINK